MILWQLLLAQECFSNRPLSPTKSNLRVPSAEKEWYGNADVQTDGATDQRNIDSTGMFHWCPEQTLASCLLVSAMKPSVREFYGRFHIGLQSLN